MRFGLHRNTSLTVLLVLLLFFVELVTSAKFATKTANFIVQGHLKLSNETMDRD